MTYTEISCFAPINNTDATRVEEIAESIKKNGWVGAPILVSESLGQLITGSHRLAAIQSVIENDWDFDADDLGDIAEDIDGIINAYCEENDCTIDQLPYDNLSLVFAGTWVEEYAAGMVEW